MHIGVGNDDDVSGLPMVVGETSEGFANKEPNEEGGDEDEAVTAAHDEETSHYWKVSGCGGEALDYQAAGMTAPGARRGTGGVQAEESTTMSVLVRDVATRPVQSWPLICQQSTFSGGRVDTYSVPLAGRSARM